MRHEGLKFRVWAWLSFCHEGLDLMGLGSRSQGLGFRFLGSCVRSVDL